MIRKLLIVFASGLVVSILLLSASWVIGGDAMRKHVTVITEDGPGDRDSDGPQTTRTFDFDGGKLLTVDGPMELRFTQGPETRMTVSGPANVVDKLTWKNGRLSPGGSQDWFDESVRITITAPQISGLALHGASDVELVGLDQPSLTIEAHGAVNLEASGKVTTLTATTHGAGNLDLESLDATDAKVNVAGVGNVDLNASGKVDAALSGAGNISLHRKPAELTTRMTGIGSINEDY